MIAARFRKLGSARQVFLSLAAEQFHFPRPSDGKSWKRTTLVAGQLRKSYGHGKPVEQWELMLQHHHESGIERAEFERNQKQLAVNPYH